MTTKLQTHQIVNDAPLKALGQKARSEVKDILSSVNKEVDFPLRIHATFPVPNSRLNFSNSLVSVGDGANRVLPPIKGQVITLSQNPYIDFMTGASSASDFDIAFPTSSGPGLFRRVGFTLIGSGQIKVLFSSEFGDASVLPNAGTLLVSGGVPIGYIDIESIGAFGFKTAGSFGAIIENTKIYRFGSGAGGGGGSGDASDFTENLKVRLVESFFNYVTPVVFATVGSTMTEAASTATYNIADESYDFTVNKFLLTKVLFNQEFLATGNIARTFEVHAEFAEGTVFVNETALFQLTLDGVSFTTVPMERQGLSRKFTGRATVTTANTFNLMLKVTATTAGPIKLKAVGVFYDEFKGTAATGEARTQVVTVDGNLNINQFSLSSFNPEEDKLKVYDSGTGQVFVAPAFTVANALVIFPVGFFHVPGETIILVFEQL